VDEFVNELKKIPRRGRPKLAFRKAHDDIEALFADRTLHTNTPGSTRKGPSVLSTKS